MTYTKNAIVDAFWQLLEEKPYSKVTVKDIVDRCKINRNTFYYHFHDIPHLLETVTKSDADSAIQAFDTLASPKDCLALLMDKCMQRKKAILNIYRSTDRELFLNELNRIILYAMTEYTNACTATRSLPPEEKKLYIWFYKCMITGVLLDWLSADMGYDMLTSFGHLEELMEKEENRLFFRLKEFSSDSEK